MYYNRVSGEKKIYKCIVFSYIQPKSLGPKDFLAFYLINKVQVVRKEIFTNDMFNVSRYRRRAG